MTGRELIMHIMQNHLEDEVVIDTISDGAAAAKFGVGVQSIRVWYELGILPGWIIDDKLVVWKNAPDPRKRDKNE